jgi:hypothetical protein
METTVVLEHQISLGVFDTQLGVQHMEYICELWHCLVPFLSQCGPSHVLVIIDFNKVVLFLNIIPERIPSGCDHKYCRFLSFPFLTVSLPPILDMGDILKECKGNLFSIKKNMNRKIPF